MSVKINAGFPRPSSERGFLDFGKITDSHGSEITVRESSAATDYCCWIFCNGAGLREAASPHLTVDNARELIAALELFVENKGQEIAR